MDDKTAQQAKSLANFVWQIAETLRGDFKQSEYGKVILPFVVLRRLDCILEPTRTPFCRRTSLCQKASTSKPAT